MAESIALSSDEIREVTGYKLSKKQIDALILMDIPFKIRPDGTPFVARAIIMPQQQIPAAANEPKAHLNDF